MLTNMANKYKQKQTKKKSTNQKQELPMATMFVNGSGRNKYFSRLTFHRCFLSSFGSFGQAVSEKVFRNYIVTVSFIGGGPGKSH
jgi:hypothetical protein